MSLRVQAEADLAFILEDSPLGFGWPIKVTNPAGAFLSLTGYSNDIAQVIDPDTGQAISGRVASAVLRIASLYAGGMTLPRGVSAPDARPWVVEFDDINGKPYKFKVLAADPDRALGVIVCMLEGYSND